MKVVILGGSYAALIAARNILKKTNENQVELVIVSPSDSFLTTPAVPRLLVEEDSIKEAVVSFDRIFKDLRKYEHVKGYATDLNPKDNTVTVSVSDKTNTINYDYLIVATGTHTTSTIYKDNTVEKTVENIKSTTKTIQGCKSIAVIGGGPTGVETASEIASCHKDIKVNLYAGNKGPLPMMNTKRINSATDQMKALGINIINGVQVTNYDSKHIELPSGESKDYDLVIPATGIKPNSDFIPKSLLSDDGYLKVNEYLMNPDYENIIGFGDIISSGSRCIADLVMSQSKSFMATINNKIITGNGKLVAYKKSTSATLLVPISKSGGVAEIFGWCLPQFILVRMKSKDFMLSQAQSYFDQY